MTDEPETQEPQGTKAVTLVKIRRAPKYPIFIVLGAGLGAVVAFILTALFPIDPAVGFGALFGYLALYGIPIGVVVGALVAMVLDRMSSRHATTVEAEHTTVDPQPVEGETEGRDVDR
jgi:H+/gluconate symporter-like permease